jgi:alkylation response protein AidB-like acyl-CoA dehydrogenase
MDFSWSYEQLAMRDSIRALLAKECPPERVHELDRAHEFPMDIWRRLGEQGWLGLPIPEGYGGAEGSTADIALVAETLSYGMTGLAAAYQRSACYGGMVISAVGTEEQKRSILPRLANGEAMVAIALTEPEAGSDAASLRTRAAHRPDGSFVLNGQKVYISGAAQASWIIVAARTDPDAPPREGITTFIVPAGTPGMVLHPMDKLGNWTVPTSEVFLDDVVVSESAILGGLNTAWQTTLAHGLDNERIVIGATCTGSAQRAIDVALQHARTRTQFGRKLGSFQLIKHKLVEMDTRVESGRLITYRAAWLADQGVDCRKEAAMAKLVASEAWNFVAYEALQVLGGMGYMMESEAQRHFRDARLYTIGGGTSEIQRLIIAHALGLGR